MSNGPRAKLRAPSRAPRTEPSMKFIEGDMRAAPGARFAILASRWNPRVTDALVEGARKAFLDNGVAAEALDFVRVPGAWELPLVAARSAPPASMSRSSRWVASCAATRAITNTSPIVAPTA